MSLPEQSADPRIKATIFVSHASEDDAFVDWLGWQIEDLGYRAIIDHWDFAAHRSFITQMDRALSDGARLLAVISPPFVASPHCRTEWEMAYQADPDGQKGLVVCGRVAACEPPAILKRYPWQDFFGTEDQDGLRRRLLLLLERARAKPKTPPALPKLGGPAPTKGQPAPAAPPPSLLENYLHLVLQETQFLRLELIDRRTATESACERLRLAGVYTRLEVVGSEDGEKVERALAERGELKRRAALADANRHPRLALLGPPGSGKSTFTDMLALCLAGERLGRPEANLKSLGEDWQLGSLVPIRIALREFAAQPGAPTLWEFCAARWRENLPGLAETLRQHLLVEGGLFLLDGLDEVPEAAGIRQRVKSSVLKLGEMFPKARLLLTSRTYAYQKQEWRLPGFAETVLAPFSKEQWEEFITRWYAHLAEVRTGLARAAADGQARLLRETVTARPHLQELAARPLLLTLMASLHALRGGTLPDHRHQLYEQSVELLIDAWERPKVVWRDGAPALLAEGVQDFLNADREQFRRALGRLAFAAHRDQQDVRGCADVTEGALAVELLKLAGDQVRPERLLEYVRDRAGILTHAAAGVYRFPHRSFQEYLAARHLCREGFPHEPARLVRAEPERWREVFLLAGASVAAASPFSAWALLDALLPSAVRDVAVPKGDDWLAALLAGQLLVESHLADGGLPAGDAVKRDRVRDWLVRLIREADLPIVDRDAAGNTLGTLGDPRPGVTLAANQLPGLEWITIPAGAFQMGGQQSYQGGNQFQCGLIQQPYRISRYPVTVTQYQAFLDAQDGYHQPQHWQWSEAAKQWWEKNHEAGPENYDPVFQTLNHPRVGVCWFEAVAFCQWLGEKLQRDIRLPSEAEWERAARGVTGRAFAWGDEENFAERCNCGLTQLNHTSAVGLFPLGGTPPEPGNGQGVADLTGNVWEWCRTSWLPDYKDYENKVTDDLAGDRARGLRGASWDFRGRGDLLSSLRDLNPPDYRGSNVGFRVVCVGVCAG